MMQKVDELANPAQQHNIILPLGLHVSLTTGGSIPEPSSEKYQSLQPATSDQWG